MSIENDKKKIEKLRETIDEYRYRYHVLNDPSVTDDIYSQLMKELEDLERKYPHLVTPDSPTQRVASKPLDGFKKQKHKFPMLSLSDAFSISELEEWESRNAKNIGHRKFEYLCELKIDGLAMSIIYMDSVFYQGVTRGDGKTGEDVSLNVKTIKSIPLKLKKHIAGRLEVRGEVYIRKEEFEKINEKNKKEGLPLYANPRNLASGTMRQLDSNIVASRNLSFYAWDIVEGCSSAKTHYDIHNCAFELGFPVEKHYEVCKDLNDVERFYKKIMKIRDKLEYHIDGIVVSINNIEQFKRLGVVGKSPRASIAYKFPAERVTTVLEGVFYQVGRTGRITPVAVLKPVNLAGTIVKRATLHNWDEIKRLGIKIGDHVIVQKAGDIIPDVVEVVKKLRIGNEKDIKPPKKCPICKLDLIRKEGEVDFYCLNKKCYAVQKESIKHFVSKKAFNIEGLGDKIIEQLIDSGIISNICDLFSITEDMLIPLERFAELSARNIVKSIEKSKRVSLDRFLFSLGIRHIGEETAKIITNTRFHNLEYPITEKNFIKNIKKIKKDDLLAINGIGVALVDSFEQFFSDKENLKLIQCMFEKGVKIVPSTPQDKSNLSLYNKKFIITGVLSSMSREEAKDKILEQGGRVLSSVSKNIDYVVVGDNPGSKYKKAQDMGLKILNEEEFLKMIGV